MKNKLINLNDHLFEQLERLNDEYIKGDALLEEIGRASAITNVAKTIVDNADLMFKAQKHYNEFGVKEDTPSLLRLDVGKNE